MNPGFFISILEMLVRKALAFKSTWRQGTICSAIETGFCLSKRLSFNAILQEKSRIGDRVVLGIGPFVEPETAKCMRVAVQGRIDMLIIVPDEIAAQSREIGRPGEPRQ